MIARIWQGTTRTEDADEYLERMRRIAFPEEAIRRFAGDDPDRAIFYPEDERYLVERGEQVSHFELVHVSLDGLSREAAR